MSFDESSFVTYRPLLSRMNDFPDAESLIGATSAFRSPSFRSSETTPANLPPFETLVASAATIEFVTLSRYGSEKFTVPLSTPCPALYHARVVWS